jgi:hypothetical protein
VGGGRPRVRGSPEFANETHIIIRLLRMYIPRNWEFGSALEKLRNFGGGLNPPNPPRYATGLNSTNVHYKATQTLVQQIHYKHAIIIIIIIIIIIMRFRIGMPSFKKMCTCVLAFDQSLFSFLFLKNAH